jgi:hypothetical protein
MDCQSGLANKFERGKKIMKKTWCSFLAILTIAMCLSGIAAAQEISGSIIGTVKDTSGAIVAGATVTVVNPSKGNLLVRTVTTNDSGEFSVPNIPIGKYSVSVEAPNFKRTTQTDIEVLVGQRRPVDLVLTAGRIDETVTVTADTVAVETSTPTASNTFNKDQLTQLSVNNRNFIQLVTLAPGVSSNLSDQVYVGTTNPEGQANTVAISVNGARSSQNTFTVDGADITDRGSNITIQSYPSLDSICNYRVLRSLYPAESGSSGGGQVNVVGCGGGNEFHGSLFEFVRNEKFNANTFNLNRATNNRDTNGKAKRPPFRYNNYGFTIGGPIWFLNFGEHDPGDSFFAKIPKTFFFFSEERRDDIRYVTLTPILPDAALRNGIFPIDICLSAVRNGATRTCNQILPAGTALTGINPVSAAYVGIYNKVPLPNSGLANDPYRLTFPTRNTSKFQQEILKIDTSITKKLFAYYRYERDTIPTLEANSLFSSGSGIPDVSTTQTDSPGRTHTFQMNYSATPNMLFEGRYSYAYGAILSHNVGLMALDQTTVPANLAYPNQRDRIPTATGMGFNGFSSFGPYNNFSDKHTYTGNMTYIMGSHTTKYGVIYSKYRKNENALAGNNEGAFSNFFNTVPGSGTAQESVCAPTSQLADTTCAGLVTVAGKTFSPSTLQSYANFLLGNNVRFVQAKSDYTADLRQQNIEFYGQDEWRIKNNLTLYYGLRYSFFGSPWDRHGLQSNFVPEFYNRAEAPLVTGAGNRVVGSGNFCEGLIVNSQNVLTAPNGCVPQVSPFGKFVVKSPKNNFAPRVGIAWDPFKKGTTSVRMGYGIYHDQTLVGIFEQNLISNPPFQETTQLDFVRMTDSFGTSPVAGLAPITVRGEDINWRTPYMQHWSLDVQHQFGKNTIVDVGYYGSKGTHLIGIVDLNLFPPGAAEKLLCPVGASTTGTVACKTAGVPFTGAQDTRLDNVRPYRGYRAISMIQPRFNSNYHSLQVSATQRFSGASQIQIAYTWSKNLTDNQTDRSTAPQNPYDIHSDYGRAQLDRRHVFTANYIYEIPFFNKTTGFAQAVLGGWQISGITTFQTGLPFTPTIGSFDASGLGLLGASNSSARPYQYADPFTVGPIMANPDPLCHITTSQLLPGSTTIHGIAAEVTGTLDSWYNRCAFQTTASLAVYSNVANVPGTAGRGVITGPDLFRTDLTLAKNIRFTESMRLQLRWEVFNVFNKTNFTTFSTTPVTAIPIISGFRDPRTMQFGIKFLF